MRRSGSVRWRRGSDARSGHPAVRFETLGEKRRVYGWGSGSAYRMKGNGLSILPIGVLSPFEQVENQRQRADEGDVARVGGGHAAAALHAEWRRAACRCTWACMRVWGALHDVDHACH